MQPKILNGMNNGKRITGLGFRKYGPSHILFVTTEDAVYRYLINCKAGSCTVQEPYTLLDEGLGAGCENGCSTMSDEGDLVIGNKTGIWFYKPESKGQMFGGIFEGKKIILDWFRSYLVIVSCDFNKNNNIQQIITVYDLKNKYIAFKYASEKLQVSHIIQEWGSLFILAKERLENVQFVQMLFQLEEKDTQTKLETLLQKNFFSIAINLVKSQNLDINFLIDIFTKYGDHLYSKKDYEGAMKQYVMTIGRLEPSYVIRKFLDAQRITNLITYLETLHEKNLASEDHTTLLLHCYTKLKDAKKEKLDNFIRTHTHYDVQTAISVCRHAGYKEHALLLAEKHSEHKWYIKIWIEDFVGAANELNYRRALRHIESLHFVEATKFMAEYGTILVSKIPKQTTNVLIRLCTDYFPIPSRESVCWKGLLVCMCSSSSY